MAIDTPDTLRTTAFYQIFFRNFTPQGTIQAAVRELPRVRELAFDWICLTPVHPVGVTGRKGSRGSPYAVKDYLSIDPELGTIHDFQAFLGEAHRLGFKVMIDIVFNHTAPDSVLAQEHPEWFIQDPDGNPGRKISDWSDVIDLDFTYPEMRNYLFGVLEYWRDEGVDGFRCDVAPLVPLDFWIEARRRVNSKREIVWLAESVEKNFIRLLRRRGYGACSDTELHDAFDLTYDYDGFEYLKPYFRGELPLSAYLDYLYIQETLYPAHAVKARFLENHDLRRAAEIVGGENRLRNWTVFSMSLEGAFFAYMGQECEIAEWPNLFDRMPIQWEKGSEIFRNFFAEALVETRKMKTETRFLDITRLSGGVLLLERSGGARDWAVIVNLESKAGTVAFPKPVQGTDVLSGKKVSISGSIVIPCTPLVIRKG